MGFIFRISQEFRMSAPLKALYCALVCPILDYVCVLWDPSTSGASAIVERVQRKFLHYTAFKLGILHPPRDNPSVLRWLNFSTFANRRHALNLSFLFGLLSGKFDSLDLLSLINLKVSAHSTRSRFPFQIPLLSTNYHLNSSIIRLMLIANTDTSFTNP